MLALGTDRLEFEAEVERALRPIGPLVALGKPLEHMGAGRIRVGDHEWRDAVERLMDAAELIVLLPSSRPGTTWEVRTLLSEGRLVKTIVVDPPDDLGADDATYDPSEEWAEVRRAFAAEGFSLPPDDSEGCCYTSATTRPPSDRPKSKWTAPARFGSSPSKSEMTWQRCAERGLPEGAGEVRMRDYRAMCWQWQRWACPTLTTYLTFFDSSYRVTTALANVTISCKAAGGTTRTMGGTRLGAFTRSRR